MLLKVALEPIPAYLFNSKLVSSHPNPKYPVYGGFQGILTFVDGKVITKTSITIPEERLLKSMLGSLEAPFPETHITSKGFRITHCNHHLDKEEFPISLLAVDKSVENWERTTSVQYHALFDHCQDNAFCETIERLFANTTRQIDLTGKIWSLYIKTNG